MNCNVGTIDRLIRALVVAPLAIFGAAAFGPTTPGGVVLLAVAALMLLTAAFAYCPLYAAFRLTTCAARGR